MYQNEALKTVPSSPDIRPLMPLQILYLVGPLCYLKFSLFSIISHHHNPLFLGYPVLKADILFGFPSLLFSVFSLFSHYRY